MDIFAKLIKILEAQPLPMGAVLLSLFVLTCIGMPVWRFGARRLEQRLEGDWEAGTLRSTWLRVEAFLLIVHCGLAITAAIWCAFWTDLPAPGFKPDELHPLGPELMRIWAYSIAMAGGCIALAALLMRANSQHTDRSPFRHMPKAMLVGIGASTVFIAYSVLLDRSLMGSIDQVPPSAFHSLPWLYCWLSFLSLSMSVIVYVPLLVLRSVWRLTASIP